MVIMKGEIGMKLRLWVEILLIIITTIAFIILGSETNDTTLYVVSKLIALIVFCFNITILEKYGKLLKD